MSDVKIFSSMDEAIEIAVGHLDHHWQDDSFDYEYGSICGIEHRGGWVLEADTLEVVAKVPLRNGWMWGEDGCDGKVFCKVRDGLVAVLEVKSVEVTRQGECWLIHASFTVEGVAE